MVLDTCAFTPNSVKHLLNRVGDGLQRYVLVSSASVYADCSQRGPRESDSVPDASTNDLQVAAEMESSGNLNANSAGDSYGPLKRACERMAEEMLGDRAISLRAGLLVGAGDYTDRMTWWVRRADEGGLLPVPLPETRPLQAIDVRDAAAFALKAAADSRSGIFNLTSQSFTMRHLLDTCQAVTKSTLEIDWVDERAFIATRVEPWTELPLWLADESTTRHFFEVDVTRAIAAGLTFRALHETVNNILEWDRSRRHVKLGCGLTRDKEAEILRATGTSV